VFTKVEFCVDLSLTAFCNVMLQHELELGILSAIKKISKYITY
jgi:hypothetical protein